MHCDFSELVGRIAGEVGNQAVREKLEFADYPESFEGFPICLVSAGLLALAFMGFSGMKIG